MVCVFVEVSVTFLVFVEILSLIHLFGFCGSWFTFLLFVDVWFTFLVFVDAWVWFTFVGLCGNLIHILGFCVSLCYLTLWTFFSVVLFYFYLCTVAYFIHIIFLLENSFVVRLHFVFIFNKNKLKTKNSSSLCLVYFKEI